MLAVAMAGPAAAVDEARLDKLFARLEQADPGEARRIAKEIELELSKSGSPAMDLLLKRGRDALEAGETGAAIEHLTALTDHVPDFAQGWHLRAIAFAKKDLYGPALADLERALALRPRHFAALYGLGTILGEVGRPGMAREVFEKVLSIHPHFKDVPKALERLDRQRGGATL
ncbi:tetratricopeptide repeat protein [Roseovarius salinarum]|uniref:tetratricopeptide repeat protein n=1 Tax=Roseovarius salinarum TaxID=1981892 RepID=UPI001E49D868|nr:tetratricopeptide repeat protein [Roseovarius salinarum]